MADIYNDSFISLGVKYYGYYKEYGRKFIDAFLNCPSLRTECYEIVRVFKIRGLWMDVLESGKDFSDYANKEKLEDKWKPVLAETLLIVYWMTQLDTAETADTKEG